jgi:hypothetical protein
MAAIRPPLATALPRILACAAALLVGSFAADSRAVLASDAVSAGRSATGCAAAEEQGLAGLCVDSARFANEARGSGSAGAGALDAVGTAETDAAAVDLARETNQQRGVERAFRVDVASDELGAPRATVTPISGLRAGRMRAVMPAAALDGAGALVHTHPRADGEPLPGDEDWQAPALGVPNYIAYGRRVLVVEISGGQFRARVVAGSLSAAERADLVDQLDLFQRETEGSRD